MTSAENVDGVRLAARVSSKYGKGARGALRFTGRMTLKLGSILYELLGWLLTAAIRVLGALWVMFRLILWVAQRPRIEPATSGP